MFENRTGTWRFGVYEVDTRRLQLRRNGIRVKLREQSFRILVELLEHAGQVVTREHLRQLLWATDTFVDFDHSLNAAVMKVRSVLGDPAAAPMYIETIPKRGYRFIAPVVFVPDNEVDSAVAAESTTESAGVEDEFSLAVLPFKCTGAGSETSSFAEGLADEIVSGLARFTYLRLAGKDCGSRYVLDGALRQAGSKLRTTVRLGDSASGETLWTETYEQPFEPDSLFDLQDYLVPRVVSTIADCRGILSRSIGEALRSMKLEEITPQQAVLRTCAYLECRTSEEHAVARATLEQAVQSAPEDSLCWAMLSHVSRDEFAYGFNPRSNSLDRAFAAAQRATETGPHNHLAHLALACALFFRKDFHAFRGTADRALELNPLDGFSIATLGSLIAFSGEWGLGCALAERAHDLNPHQAGRYWFGHLFNAYRKGDYATAVEIALRIDMPRFWQSNLMLAAAYGQLGKVENARRSLEALEQCWPEFLPNARERLSRWWDSSLVDRLLEGIQKIEVDSAAARVDSAPEDLREHTAPDGSDGIAIIETQELAAGERISQRSYLALTLSLLFAIVVLIAIVLVRRYT